MSDQALMLARLTNRPLMVTADYLDSVLKLLADRREVPLHWSDGAPESTEGTRYRAMQDKSDRATHEGLALIGIDGSLAHKSGKLAGASSTMRSYASIRRDIEAAMDDENVAGIVLDIDSPGGEVSGNFALADFIASQRGRKPMLALADEFATSAAYNIAAAADQVVAPSGAMVGSIGVLLAHVTEARALSEAGIDVTLIRGGERKARSNNVEELDDTARNDLQKAVNQTYGRFVNMVAAHRGIDADAVRATEARVYDAEEAMELGLVDAVMSVDVALGLFAERSRERAVDSTSVPASLPTQETSTMSANQGAVSGTEEAAVPEPIEAPDLDAIRAEAMKAERERVNGIHALASAQLSDQHRALAIEYVEMGLSVEAADKLLCMAPAPAKPAAVVPQEVDVDVLAAAMAVHGEDVDAVEATLTEGDEDPEAMAAIAAADEYRRDTESHVRYAQTEGRV